MPDTQTADPPAAPHAAPAAPVTPPVTPIAGAMPNTPPAPAAPAAGDAPAFDWKNEVPKGAPWGDKYKSWADVDKTLKSTHSENQRLKAQIEGKPQVTTDTWRQLQAEYFKNGTLPDEAFDTIEKASGIPRQFANDIFAYTLQQRTAFIESANAELGEGVPYEDVEGWLQSGQSQFSPEAIIGFYELSASGDTSWLKGVGAQYRTAFSIPEQAKTPNTQPQMTPVPPSRQAPTRSGFKPSGTAQHQGYNTRAEYHLAIAGANVDGGAPAKVAVQAKLKATPAQVIASWGPSTG